MCDIGDKLPMIRNLGQAYGSNFLFFEFIFYDVSTSTCQMLRFPLAIVIWLKGKATHFNFTKKKKKKSKSRKIFFQKKNFFFG